MTMSAGKITDILSGRQWQQVLERDASADGRFFYAVRSTGIVCRPTCPSRRPARSNVQFFPTLTEAIQAGFRPCRRCHPERTTPAPDPQAAAVDRAARYLKEHAGERVTTSELAKVAGTNRLTLHRAFRRIFGVSPAQYTRQQRLKTFHKTIRESNMRVTDAIYDAGFGSSSRLYENSGARLGMTPARDEEGSSWNCDSLHNRGKPSQEDVSCYNRKRNLHYRFWRRGQRFAQESAAGLSECRRHS